MKNIIPVVSSFGGGVLVGGAYAAFITMLQILPRLIQLTKTRRYLMFYEILLISSSISFTLIYFFEVYLRLNTVFVILFGLFSGIFLGLFSSALAETLNVLPIISKKFKIKKHMKIIFFSLLFGKVSGALYYFLFFSIK